MARTKKTEGVGHNSGQPLSEDDEAALVTYYELKILEGQRALDALLVDVSSARKVVNGHFKRLHADLQFTRREFEAEVIAKANMTEAEYLAAEKRRDRLHRLSGRKPGEQLDLIDDVLGDTVDDQIKAEAAGYRVGHVAGDPKPSDNIDPIFHPDWMRGWHKAQEDNAAKLGRANEIIAARAKPTVELTAEEDVEEDALDPEVIKAKARKLKNEGWTEPTPGEAQLEDAAA